MEKYFKRVGEDKATNASKKCKYVQKFKDSYRKEWPCLLPGKEGFAYCTVCRSEFSIAHGGRDDCRRHVTCKKHIELLKSLSCNQKLDQFCIENDDFDATRAESLFARFLVEHNIPISVADHAGSLFKNMFPDSNIAKKFASGRTKTAAIIRANSASSREKIINAVKCNSFALSTDGSNDMDDKKLYPLIVSYFDHEKGQIVTVLLSLLESLDNTGEGIFNLINSEFSKLGIKWDNCVSFGCDNANTMIGQFKGVASFIKQKQPHIKVVGCPCHLVHLVAQKATKTLPVDVENIVVQLFYYLEKSSKRKNKLKECQISCELKPHKILKHVSTRWLSLELTLKRVIEQWEALQKFFAEKTKENTSQFFQLKELLESPKTKLYCLFLLSVMPTFTAINMALQKEEPCIHLLSDQLKKLYFDILVRFVKPASISQAQSVFVVDYKKTKHQKHDNDLIIGSKTRSFLNCSNLKSVDLEEFYSSIRRFYCVAADYMLKKFPLQDEFYDHASVANISNRESASYDSVKYFANLFNCFEENDELEMEFARYQSDAFSLDILQCSRIDHTWHKIGKLKYDGTDILKYQVLPKIMLSILTVPHSNASTERVFSIVRKNKNEFRPTLGVKTLEALLVEKLSIDCCYNKIFTTDELKRAKSSCFKELQESKI